MDQPPSPPAASVAPGTAAPGTAAPTPASAAAPQRRSGIAVVSIGVATLLVSVVTALAALTAAAWWAVGSERGSAWLLAALPGVEVIAPKGRLLGDFEAQQVTIRLPGGVGGGGGGASSGTVVLQGIGWHGLSVARTTAPRWFRIGIEELHASRVDVALKPAPQPEPIALPANLRLPIEFELRALRIDELHLPALGDTPLRDLQARLHLGAAAGAEHRIDAVALRWDRLRASGSARIAAAAPMALDAALTLVQDVAPALSAAPAAPATAGAPTPPTTPTLPAWRAQATLTGPLAAPVLQTTLSAQPSAQRPAQAMVANATLRPFARWPLGDVQVRTDALDLSAFSSAAPATALSGQAIATSSGLDQPARVSVALSNALAGAWNEGRLPLRSLTFDLSGRPDQPGVLAFQTLVAELGTSRASAGRVTGAGHWTAERWNLDATLVALQPARLDARAPAMQLNGTLALSGGGPPTALTSATSTTSPASPAPPAPINLKASLTGSVTDRGSARAVQLGLDAGAQWQGAQRIEVRNLQLRAGGASASLTGVATQASTAAPWAIKAHTALQDFDPAVWWPGRDDAPWRKAVNRLNAKGTLDLSVPASVAEKPLVETLAALRGEADLTLTDSLLAGVPLTGEAALRSTAGGVLAATLRFDAAGNSLRAQGRLATAGLGAGSGAASGAGDAWDLSLNAASLDRLAPIFALFRSAGTDAQLAGSVNASAHVSGRWPAVSSTGQLDASALRLGRFGVQAASAHWRAGSSTDSPLNLDVSVVKVEAGSGAPSIESASLRLDGSARTHTLALRAESKALPPAWTEALAPPSPGGGGAAGADDKGSAAARTVATLQAAGGFTDLPSTPLAGWRGSVQQLELRAVPAPTDAKPLLRSRDVAIEAQWAGGPARVALQPGRAELLGGALRWSRIAWHAAAGAGQAAQIDAEAEIEPLRIAPILARAQPDFGWGGDLTVGGRLRLHSAPGFAADIVIERRAGDLTVTDDLGTQALGLTDLRLALAARDGVWNFTQAVAGTALGAGAGAVVLRTSAQAVWPAPDTPIEGVFELQVAHLATWGTWVPPGWRIDGALRASASIGGRFGAPQYTGQITGSQLSVRNFLQGVNVSDGDVSIRLEGSGAHIERFTARGGSGGSASSGGGSVKVEGDASFGAAPQALLTVTAERFQLLGRVDRRIVTSGQARLKLDAASVGVNGKFDVDEGLIDFTRSDAPALASDVEVRRGGGAVAAAVADAKVQAQAQAPALPVNPRRDIALDLSVSLGQKLRIRGRGLDAGLRGELRITSPGGRLAVNGTVQAADGTYAAYGQKLAIDRGVIVFNGDVGNPRLDIEATRPNLDLRVGVAVAGTAANPRIRLFSEPELSELDKLSWLVMGRASDGLGRADTALLQRAALALLSGEGGGITDQFTKAIGLDELSLRQSGGEVRDTVISLGKQLSRRWYVGYERGLNATTGSWQLIYRIARRFTLRAQSGEDNSLDLIWTWRWQ